MHSSQLGNKIYTLMLNTAYKTSLDFNPKKCLPERLKVGFSVKYELGNSWTSENHID